MNLKLSFSIIAMLAVFGIAVFIFSKNNDPITATSLEIYHPNRAEVHRATLNLLAAAPGLVRIESTFLTIGPGQNVDTWSVRGTFNKENRNIPLFAAVRYHCADRKENDKCWSLDELIIDGDHSRTATHKTAGLENSNVIGSVSYPNPQSAGSSLVRKTSKTQSLSEANAPTTPKSSIETKTDIATSNNQTSAKSMQQPSDTRKANSSIWRTRSDNVNARSGPGLDYDIIFKMSAATALILIEKQEAWGLFEYPAANREQAQVWIHMNMVRRNSN